MTAAITLPERLERRPTGDLVPYARNARTHSDAQIQQLAEAMREWGFTNPVLIDETGGIIAGHGRVLAARRLQLPEVPVLVAAGWSEAKRRAFVIADNKLALNAGWDDAMLAAELADLRVDGFELSVIGFDGDALLKMLGDGPNSRQERENDEDEGEGAGSAKNGSEAVSRVGDVWMLGEHRFEVRDLQTAAFADGVAKRWKTYAHAEAILESSGLAWSVVRKGRKAKGEKP